MIIQLLAKANSRELNGVATSTVSIIVKSATTDANLVKLNTNLKGSNEKLTVALDRSLGSDKTEHIWELEGARDNGLKSLFTTVEGCIFRLNKEVAAAGSLIYEVIVRLGRTMYSLPHLEQTSKMDTLFKELAAPAMVAALQTTQTTAILDETKKANQDFLDAFDERTEEAANKKEIILVSNSRKDVKTGLEKIVNYLDSVAGLDGTAGLQAIRASIGQVIADTNSNIRARLTRKENAKKEEPKKE